MKENLPPVMLSNLICVCTSTYWQNVYATGSYKQVIPTKACLIKIKNKKIDPYQSYRKGLFTLVTLTTIEYAWWPSKKTIEPYQSCHKGLCTLVMPDTTEYAGRPALVLHVTLPGVTRDLAWCWTTGHVQHTCTCRMQFTLKAMGLLGVNKKLTLVWTNWKQRWSSLSYKKVQFLPAWESQLSSIKTLMGLLQFKHNLTKWALAWVFLNIKNCHMIMVGSYGKLQRRWCAEN